MPQPFCRLRARTIRVLHITEEQRHRDIYKVVFDFLATKNSSLQVCHAKVFLLFQSDRKEKDSLVKCRQLFLPMLAGEGMTNGQSQVLRG